jgi:hypothetical protein
MGSNIEGCNNMGKVFNNPTTNYAPSNYKLCLLTFKAMYD